MLSAAQIIQNSKNNSTGTTGSTATPYKSAMDIIRQSNPTAGTQPIQSTPAPKVGTVKISQTQPKPNTIQSLQKGASDFLTGAENLVKNAVKGITFKLVQPTQQKVQTPAPQQTQAPAPQKPITINQGQNKLTSAQLQTVVGTLPGQTSLSAAPKKNIWQNITNSVSEFFSPSKDQQARDMNAYAVKTTVGKNLDINKLAEKGGNPLKNSLMENVTKELGIRSTPTGSELGQKAFAAGAAIGLIEAAPATLAGLGIFSVVNEIKSGLISAVKGKGFKLGANQSFSDLFENAPADVKNVLDIVDFLATAKVTHGIFKASPKVFDTLTKDTIEKVGGSPTVNLSPSEVKKINLGQGGKYESDLIKSLGLNGDQWKAAVQKGITIEVPTEKLTRIVDKPYWEKIKSILGKEPTNIETRAPVGAKTTTGFAGYLTDGERTPNQVIGDVIKAGQENTAEGKATIKVAIDAQQKGQNIVIQKSLPEPTKSAGLLEGPKPSNVGEGFTMTAKADQSKIDISQKLNDYKYALDRFNKNPTPTTRVRFEKAKAIVDKLKTGGFVEQKAPEQSKAVTTTTPSVKVAVGESKSGITEAPSVKVEPKTVSIPREQIPVGTGKEKVSRLEQRVQESIGKISQEAIDKLGPSTYKELNKKENIAAASKYVTENPNDAIKVLTGEIQAPKGILRNSVYVAMQNAASGDVNLARKLASIGSTRMGQEISILSEIDKNSPVKLSSDIYKIQEEQFRKRYGGKSAREITQNYIKKGKAQIKPPKLADWGNIIKEVRC